MPRGKVLSMNFKTKEIILENENKKKVVKVNDKYLKKIFFNVGDLIEYQIEKTIFIFKGKLKEKNYPYNFVSLGNPKEINRHEVIKGNNSGKLICTIENKTPLFIGDPEKILKGEKNHTKESFLEENGKYIIPASSIKGEVRNIVEVLTNSCIKNVEKERLEKRLQAGKYNLHFGIVKRIPTKETEGLIVEAEKIKINRKLLSKQEGMYKEEYSSYIENFIGREKKIATKEEYEKIKNKKGIEGVLWVSSSIHKKKYEKIIIPKRNGQTFTFSYDEYEDFKYLIDQRNEREKKAGKKEFYLNDLEIGDVIIFQEELKKAKNLAFSEIPRLRYKYSPLELVPDEFKPCSKIDNLCFACRLFGSTGNGEEKKENEKITSLSGRVYFTDALIDKKEANVVSNYEILKPFGEPHPSLARFYLKSSSYDDRKAEIRGRKFYWHHKDKIEAGKNTEKYMETLRMKHEEAYNESLKYMKPENKFAFEVKFKDLTDEELGILIYALELEEDMLHKLGRAKAFGFGSCKITINKFLLDDENKYKSFVNIYKDANKDKYLKLAKEKYVRNEKTEIRELKTILKRTNDLDFSKSPFPEDIKYGKNDEEKNTLNWFQNNKNVVLKTILEK